MMYRGGDLLPGDAAPSERIGPGLRSEPDDCAACASGDGTWSGCGNPESGLSPWRAATFPADEIRRPPCMSRRRWRFTPGAPVLRIRQVVYSTQGKASVYVAGFYRSDRYTPVDPALPALALAPRNATFP